MCVCVTKKMHFDCEKKVYEYWGKICTTTVELVNIFFFILNNFDWKKDKLKTGNYLKKKILNNFLFVMCENFSIFFIFSDIGLVFSGMRV